MNFLKKIFSKKSAPVKSYQDFWSWFEKNEQSFFNAVKNKKDIERHFFDKLSPKLNEIKDGFFYLTGMLNDTTAELVLTADGNIRNIVFVEELVDAAPEIEGWRFTALKPALDINNVSINMAGYEFHDKNISFHANNLANFPDEIDITIVHDDLTEANKSAIINGTYIFLDNFLGELDFATKIDNINFIGKKDAVEELVPIEKLKDFLIWREKEFIEKYDAVKCDIENDNYAMLEATLENGNALLAVINTDLLQWDGKASHPWIVTVEIKYDGGDTNGMPGDNDYKLMQEIEDEILEELQTSENYLNIGRQTADSVREIYFACKDFRKPSIVLNKKVKEYANRINMGYDIYKDKYWRSFDRFINNG